MSPMELPKIESYLASPDPQSRMKALVELRQYEPEVVVPLLKQRMYDKEFVVRSFVAMGLGNKQNDEGFEALLNLIEHDKDPNVVAEAANSLAKYGDRALPHLVTLFRENPHWLIRQSIFAVFEELDLPETLLPLCQWGFAGEDPVVQMAAVSNTARLANTPQATAALEILLEAARSETPSLRSHAVQALQQFDAPQAKAALLELRQDSNHRVVAATLESLL